MCFSPTSTLPGVAHRSPTISLHSLQRRRVRADLIVAFKVLMANWMWTWPYFFLPPTHPFARSHLQGTLDAVGLLVHYVLFKNLHLSPPVVFFYFPSFSSLGFAFLTAKGLLSNFSNVRQRALLNGQPSSYNNVSLVHGAFISPYFFPSIPIHLRLITIE